MSTIFDNFDDTLDNKRADDWRMDRFDDWHEPTDEYDWLLDKEYKERQKEKEKWKQAASEACSTDCPRMYRGDCPYPYPYEYCPRVKDFYNKKA